MEIRGEHHARADLLLRPLDADDYVVGFSNHNLSSLSNGGKIRDFY